jgi:cytosine/uracil/thiamine/allantoin permease
MKDVLKRISAAGNNHTHDGFHLGMTIAMIILFLAFWGVSFYVLLNSYA